MISSSAVNSVVECATHNGLVGGSNPSRHNKIKEDIQVEMLIIFTKVVIFCLIVYVLFDKYGKKYFQHEFVEPVEDDSKRISYDNWVERINNCTDSELLRDWMFEDHGTDTDIWEFGLDYEYGLWYLCHDRRVELYEEIKEKEVYLKSYNKVWLIEG